MLLLLLVSREFAGTISVFRIASRSTGSSLCGSRRFRAVLKSLSRACFVSSAIEAKVGVVMVLVCG